MNSILPISLCCCQLGDSLGFGLRVYVGDFRSSELQKAVAINGMTVAGKFTTKAGEEWLATKLNIESELYQGNWQRSRILLPLAYDDNAAVIAIDYIYATKGNTTMALAFFYQYQSSPDIQLPYDSERIIQELVGSVEWHEGRT